MAKKLVQTKLKNDPGQGRILNSLAPGAKPGATPKDTKCQLQ